MVLKYLAGRPALAWLANCASNYPGVIYAEGLNVQRSTFNVQWPTFNFQRSTSNVQLPTLNFQRSMANGQGEAFNVQGCAVATPALGRGRREAS